MPMPNCPAASLRGAPVKVTPGHEPASRGQSTGSTPSSSYAATCATHELRVGIGLGGVVPAGHVDLDVPEAVLREMRPQQLQRALGGHVGHQAHVDLGDRPVRQDRLAARARVAAHEALDVDRRLGDEAHERVVPGLVAEPAVDAQRLLRGRFVLPRDGRLENLSAGAPQAARPCRRSPPRPACGRRGPTSVFSACTRCHAGESICAS